MALAFVQRAKGGSANSAVTVAAPAQSTTTGNLLVVLVMNFTNITDVSSVTDTAGNTYVRGPSTFDAPNSSAFYDVFYAKNITGNAANIVTANVGAGATYRYIVVYEVSGADLTAPYETSSTGSGTGTSYATGTLTIAASAFICAAGNDGSGGTLSGGSGYTLTRFGLLVDGTAYWFDEYHIASSSEAATASNTSSQTWAMLAAAFKVAGASSAIKAIMGLPYASVKTVMGLPIASVKTIQGLT